MSKYVVRPNIGMGWSVLEDGITPVAAFVTRKEAREHAKTMNALASDLEGRREVRTVLQFPGDQDLELEEVEDSAHGVWKP